MMKNNKGQMFIALIIFILGFLIFVFAAPMLAEIIDDSTKDQGTATRFVMKLFPWIVMISLFAVFLKIVSSGGGFFA